MYLECAALERSLEVLRLAAEDDLVEIEVVVSADDFAVRELLGLVESVNDVSLDRNSSDDVRGRLTWRSLL